jgi:hypothetical protein
VLLGAIGAAAGFDLNGFHPPFILRVILHFAAAFKINLCFGLCFV